MFTERRALDIQTRELEGHDDAGILHDASIVGGPRMLVPWVVAGLETKPLLYELNETDVDLVCWKSGGYTFLTVTVSDG